MSNIKLIALDLDGTLFNSQSKISSGNLAAIKSATEKGIYIVISSGRPFCGLPFEQLEGTGIQYAITTNGSAIYDITTKGCIYENCMDRSITTPILSFLLSKDIHMDAFIHGDAISPKKCLEAAYKLASPAPLKKYIIESRTRVEDLPRYLEENNLEIQKMTLNFYPDEKGILVDREEVKAFLLQNPNITCVSGGYNNLEFTKAGVDKGEGLKMLARYLHVPMEDTMAVGDTENDISILKAAAIGVAMANATEDVKAVADEITLSNDEDGVAAIISKYTF